MQITPKEAPELIQDVLKANLVPFIGSSPGLGKSSIAKQIAENYNLELIDVRLAGYDPTSIDGFPMVNLDRTKASYIPMNTFPIEGDPLPKGKAGWLILLDELNSAPLSVQTAAYRLVLDKQVGEHNLHSKVAIMAAGNLSTDGAIVNRTGTAMQSRMVHFELVVDNDDWLEWAVNSKMDHRITSFIRFKPQALHKFDPKHNDKTFACPRTWEFLSNIIKGWKTIERAKLPILAGTVSEGMAREFIVFCDIYKSLPTIGEILRDPYNFVAPEEPSVIYAVSGLIANHITKDTAEKLMIAIYKLPAEFQIVCLSEAIARDRSILQLPLMRKWTKDNRDLLM